MNAPDTPHLDTVSPALPVEGSAPPLPAPAGASSGNLAELVTPGRCFGDFEILRRLGAGSFAQVFLARQRSLDRLVALKVSTNQGSEARTLASLEHAHIIQVFSESVYPHQGLRLLCMQYVPGLTLARVVQGLFPREPSSWSGRAILEILDTLSSEPAALDPVALEGRAFLQACDFVEAVCWLGARLAEALAHAHSQGVLHRDIKPANILLNRYGRPFLADFNIALPTRRQADTEGEPIGGTLGYMAPEHLDAFNPDGNTAAAAVEERSDIYSLGVVLYQFLTNRLPFDRLPEATQLAESLREMTAERRAAAPSPRAVRPEIPEVLDRVVRRCLDPDPASRYQSAGELALALDGCRDLERIKRQLPAAGPVTRAVLRRPHVFLPLLALLPHFLGSGVNIAYNAQQVVDDLTPAQQTTFGHLVLGYNLVVYPVCIGLMAWVVTRVFRGWRRLCTAPPARADARTVRRQALALPVRALVLSCAGWLPGGLLFPVGLHLLSDPVTPATFGHFLISFTISGLIALTYSYFAVQYVVLRVLYPQLWSDAAGLRQQARTELGGVASRLGLFQFLAGLIPLTGALLMITVGPDRLTVTFRLLVTALIALGMLGFGITLLVSSRVGQVLGAFLAAGPAELRK